ncbi:hypothetical protein DEEACLCL_00182 [Salmonella phage CRW-SP2]|nr:hypothetical protein DEEACLCL_00182 [Salmonella phage CRW-SP2]
MKYKYSIIIGADAGNLLFMHDNFVARVRLFGMQIPQEVYCLESPDPAGGLVYVTPGSLNNNPDFYATLPLPGDSTIMARRYPVPFEIMHDNEVDARWHALECFKKHGRIHRIDGVDVKNRLFKWYIENDKNKKPTLLTLNWEHKQQLKVCTIEHREVNKICEEYKVSVIYTEAGWQAQSALFSGIIVTNKNRNRAVIEMLLLAHYSRNPMLFISYTEQQRALGVVGKLDVGGCREM